MIFCTLFKSKFNLPNVAISYSKMPSDQLERKTQTLVTLQHKLKGHKSINDLVFYVATAASVLYWKI